MLVMGVGGTGKAVVNILAFMDAVAATLKRPRPTFQLFVVDQDQRDGGLWPRIPSIAPTQLSGEFGQNVLRVGSRAAMTPDRCAARFLFTGLPTATSAHGDTGSAAAQETELETDITQGFYGKAKLSSCAGTEQEWLAHLAINAPIVVVVYSDIGGTGAGAGPTILRALLNRPGGWHVVALVLGKYLTSESLPGEEAALAAVVPHDLHAFDGRRKLRKFYLRTPEHGIKGIQGPETGLNPTPALLAPAFYAWRLAQAGVNMLGQDPSPDPARVTTVRLTGKEDGPFSTLPGEADLPSALRKACLQGNADFSGIVNRREQRHLGRLSVLLNEPGTARVLADATAAFASRWDQLQASSLSPTYEQHFERTFASFPSPDAPAVQFLAAVGRREQSALGAFLDLVFLLLHGDATVRPTGWRPPGDDWTHGPLFGLHAAPAEGGPAWETNRSACFLSTALGAFTARLPPWTVRELAGRLQDLAKGPRNKLAAEAGPEGHTLDMVIVAGTLAARLIPPGWLGIAGRPFALNVVHRDRSWDQEIDWWLRLEATDKSEIDAFAPLWPGVKDSIEVTRDVMEIGGRQVFGLEGAAVRGRGGADRLNAVILQTPDGGFVRASAWMHVLSGAASADYYLDPEGFDVAQRQAKASLKRLDRKADTPVVLAANQVVVEWRIG